MAKRKAPPKRKQTSYEFHKAKGRHQLVLYFERQDYAEVKAAAEAERRSVSQFIRVAAIRAAARAALVVADKKRRGN